MVRSGAACSVGDRLAGFGSGRSGCALQFLKPWIERQLFGRETSPSATEIPPTAPETPPTVDQPAQAPEAELQQEQPAAAEPLPDQPAPPALSEPPADGWAPSRAPFEGGPELRGTEPSTDFSSPQQDGSADAAVAPATEIEERPGVPVEATPETLRFAVLAGRSAAATMARSGRSAEELQKILGRPVEILPFPSYDTMIEAQVQRRIDGGFFSAAAFAAADSACTCVEPLVAPKALDGTLAYHAIIVARAGSGIASLADLAGKTGCNSAPPTSLAAGGCSSLACFRRASIRQRISAQSSLQVRRRRR